MHSDLEGAGMEMPTRHGMDAQPTGLLGVTRDLSVPCAAWRWGFSFFHEGVCGGRTRALRPDLELSCFLHRSFPKPLQGLQKFGFSVSGYEEWESEVPQTREQPPPASFALLLDFGRYSFCLNPLHRCCGAATLSQAITATLQQLQAVGKDVAKLDFTLLCWFIF